MLIAPEAKLTLRPPDYHGLVTQYGYGRDWRIDRDWQRLNLEYVTPLRALAPAGQKLPANMTLGVDWIEVGGFNNMWRQVYASGNPVVSWVEFYDGALYPSTASGPEFLGGLLSVAEWDPAWLLSVMRYMPPAEQGVHTQITVSMRGRAQVDEEGKLDAEGEWEDATLSLVLPLADEEYRCPFLHVIAPEAAGYFDVLTSGHILSEGPSTSAQAQGVVREGWLFETIDVVPWGEEGYAGTHFLLRNTADMSSWWWFHSPLVGAQSGVLGLTVGGSVQAVNLAPIEYGNLEGTGYPLEGQALPSCAGSEWNPTAAWRAEQTEAEGWTVGVAGAAGDLYRPYVTMTRTDPEALHRRPVVWSIQQAHAAVVEPQGGISETTAGQDCLRSVAYRLNSEWKGAEGEAVFEPASGDTEWFPALRENSLVEVHLGWPEGTGEGLDCGRVATAYILPGGLQRLRDGESFAGAPLLTLRFGDFWASRLGVKDILDLPQAGGQTVEDWAEMIGNRLGFTAGEIAVDAAVADRIIPLSSLPSEPNLAPQDGDGWEGHIRAVEVAAEVRVCFDREGAGGLQVDAGRPAYQEGVSEFAYRLDYDTLTEQDVLYRVEVTPAGRQWRTLLKATAGRADSEKVLYWSETPEERHAGIGDDWGRGMTDREATSPDYLQSAFAREHRRDAQRLSWEGPLRPDLRPDLFVQVTELPGVGVEALSVWQIEEHVMVVDLERFEGFSRISLARCDTD